MTNANMSLISPDVSDLIGQSVPPLKLGVMASGSGSNFAVVAQAIAAKKLNAQIQVLIFNHPTAYVAVRAADLGIKAVYLNHQAYKVRQDFDRQIVQVLQEHEVEWIVMAGWMRLVTEVILDAYPNKIINIHPSLLPSFKGTRAVEQALAAGVKITGCTAHLLCLEMDSGPILIQAAVPVFPDDTPETLHGRIQVQEHRILPLAIALAAQI